MTSLASQLGKMGVPMTHPAVAAVIDFVGSHPIAAGLVAVVMLVLGVAVVSDYCKRFPLRSIPSPLGLPLFGHVFYMVGTPWLALHRFAQKYGGVYLIRFWSRPFVVLSHPDHIKHVFKDQKHKYVKDQWSYDYFR